MSSRHARAAYLFAAVAAIVLGLASRRYAALLPEFVAAYAGDFLWALTAYLGVRFLFPRWPVAGAGAAALLFAFSIELSQLYHAPWIDAARHTTIGGLVLGFGFLWSDILCYAAGVGAGVAADFLLTSARRDGPNF